VAAFDGWVDAAGAATAALAHIAGDATTIATFDSDLLYDYRSRRPVLDIVDGTLKELTWYELAVRRTRAEGRDVLVLFGPEPDFRWKELGRDVMDMSLRLGVVEWISVGAIPAAVPHTRPVPVLGTASKPGLLADNVAQGPQGLLRVPAAALSVIELSVAGAGIPTVGFFAQVPHYVGGPYAAATISLVQHVGRHLGVDFPLGSLPEDATAQRQRIDAAVGADEEATAYLQRLEAMPAADDRIPSGDELASEIERYLRGESGDEPNARGR
jgi:hypothetical protein